MRRRRGADAGGVERVQEETGGLEQGLGDEALAVVVQGQALVLEQAGIAALDRPAPLAQA
jgi:hypothetical protein